MTNMNRKEMILYGIKKGIPVVIGYIPMGIGYAALAIRAGLTATQTVAMSVFVFAGAGQILAVTMLASGANLIEIVLANFFVNLRYMIFNICIYSKVNDSNPILNILTSHLAVDESFAIFTLLEESSIWIYMGLAGISWLAWIAGAYIGVTILSSLPEVVTYSFNISLYALFVAILITNVIKSKQLCLVVIITAILNIVLGLIIGANSSLVISLLIGAIIGMYIVDDEELLDDEEYCNTKEVEQ